DEPPAHIPGQLNSVDEGVANAGAGREYPMRFTVRLHVLEAGGDEHLERHPVDPAADRGDQAITQQRRPELGEAGSRSDGGVGAVRSAARAVLVERRGAPGGYGIVDA